jgi:hypothetical protein
MKHDEMWEAHYHAQQAANDLLMAYAIRAEVGRVSKIYTENAMKHAEQFAAALGYTLTPVAAPVEAVAADTCEAA